MKQYLLGVTLFLFVMVAHGQTEYLVTVDPSNFNFTKIDSIPNVKWVNIPTSNFDNLNQFYIFLGADANFNSALYTIDANTGNVISNPPFPVLTDPNDNIINLQYSNSLNTLFALHWDNSQGLEYFISINTTTGQFTIIDTLPGVAWIAGSATFDNINNRYIFKGADINFNGYLYVIDAITGSIISNPVYPSPNGNVIEFEYGNSTNTLYALHWDNPTNTEYLASLDPTTGVFSDINSIPGVAWIEEGFATFDGFNSRYIFKGGDNSGNWYLYSIDAISGNIVYNPIFPPFTGNDNIVMPQVDSLTGIMYALHWESSTTGIKENETNNHICNFFPNPFTDNSKIILDKTYKDILVFIYNASGQVVNELTASNSSEINISRDNLSDGQYYISVICDHLYSGTITTTIY